MPNIPEVNLESTKKMTMMHLRFTTLMLGVVLSLLAVVLAHKDVAMANNDKALGSSIKELTNEATVIVAAKSRNLKGRKIGVDDATKKEDRNEMINTGANLSSVGKCGHGDERRLSLESCAVVMSNRSFASRFPLVGYIPFSSDYHAPKGHPPKNN